MLPSRVFTPYFAILFHLSKNLEFQKFKKAAPQSGFPK